MKLPWDNSLSLRVRLAGWLGLLFLAGMVALYVAAQSYATAAANKSYDRLLLGSALSISETLTVDNHQIRVDLPYAALDMLSAAPDDRVFYAVEGPDGNVITGNFDSRFLSAPAGDEQLDYIDHAFGEERVRLAILRRDIAVPDGTGQILIVVGQSRVARDQLARSLVLNAITPIAAMTVIALISTWFIIGWSLAPLRQLGLQLASREPNDLAPVDAVMPSDLAPLVGSINTFMRRLRNNIDTLKSFIADAAHQMRTPLAALRAQAQAVDPDDPDDLRRGLIAVERNAEKLTHLLNQLLTDSTVTHRSDIRDFEEFDLVRMLRSCISEVSTYDNRTMIELNSDFEKAPYVGDFLMISEAVKNLVHNAFRHGNGAKTGIAVNLSACKQSYVIAVEDSGPGVADLDKARQFQRFARTSGSTGGFGLGLAIVKRVADSHDGEVRIENKPTGGLCVSLVLPRGMR